MNITFQPASTSFAHKFRSFLSLNYLTATKTFFAILFFSVSIFAVNLTDFGAVPDDNQSDSQAFQRAFDAVCAKGGGEIVFPPGVTLLTQETGGNCKFASELALRGSDGSVIEINTAPSLSILTIGNLGNFSLKNVLIIGYTSRVDAKNLFYITAQTAAFEDVIFANLSFDQAGVVLDYTNISTFKNVQFAGCTGKAMIYAYASPRLVIENSVFIDFFNYKNVYYSKSWWGAETWVKIAKSQDYPRALPSVKIEGSFFDEGAFYAVSASDLDNFIFSGNRINVNNGTDASGVKVRNTKTAIIDGNRFGWANTKHSAALFENINRFEFSNNTLESGVDHIWVTGTTQRGIFKYNNIAKASPHIINDSDANIESLE